MKTVVLLLLVTSFVTYAQMPASRTSKSDAEKIASTMQAGPKFVTQNATVPHDTTSPPMVPHAESALQCEPSAPDRTLIEEPPDQSDAVRHSARRRELRQRVIRIGGPVAARLGHLDEARAQCQRGMSGEVRNGENFVPQ
jgi:hypothetical protein